MSGIYFISQEKKARVDGKKTIADYAKELNITLNMPCGGKGICGKCKVKVDGVFSEKNQTEESHELEEDYRLACQSIPLGEAYISFSESMTRRKSIQPRVVKTDGKEGYGIALDIGTTTLAAYLIDTKSGEVVKECSRLNPQRVYGDDVISRIGCRSSKVYETLKNGINDILEELLNDAEPGESVKVKAEEVHSICVVGNPTMHHFFLDYDVSGLGKTPFQPVSKKAEMRKAKELGLNLLKSNTTIYMPPIIAGFIGSDVLADILASRLYSRTEPSLLIDFGTNGEIALSDGNKILAVSCAMGPAFEGGRIKHGSIAKEGTIEKVKIIDGKFFYAAIGDEKPTGICGTGIVDLVAELHRTALIDNRGIFSSGEREIKLTGDIRFSRNDISEVQLAKAAMQAGIDILLEEAGLSLDELSIVFVAGSFGNFLNPENARRVGLVPNVSLDKIKIIGNAAGEGAREMLLSKSLLNQAEEIAENIEYLELMDRKYNFNDKYMMNMYF